MFDGQSIVHEASVSVPLTDLQTRFIAGQMPDWSGYEYLQPTLNKLITHNLLFDFTLPTAYTGAGLEITSGKWIVKGMLANMNASTNPSGREGAGDRLPRRLLEGRVPGLRLRRRARQGGRTSALDDTSSTAQREPGQPRPGGKHTRLDLFEVDAYFIRGDWTVQGQVSYRQAEERRRSLPTRSPAICATPAGGACRRWRPTSARRASRPSARLDYVNNKKNGGGLLGYTGADDRNGIGPDGAGDPEVGAQRAPPLYAGRPSWLFNLNTTFKAEYRLDRASQPVFIDVKDGSYRKTNHLLGASVVVSF